MLMMVPREHHYSYIVLFHCICIYA